MKKMIWGAALALAVLTCSGLLASASAQPESLVSLSYLNGIFWEDLKATARMDVERNTTAFFQDILSEAGRSPGAAGPGIGGAVWTVSDHFTAQTGTNGDIVTVGVGSGLIWTSGSGMVRSGALVDVTAGSEVAAGGLLATGHRYLAGTDVVLVAASDAAGWLAEGKWSVAAGDPVQPPASLPFTDVAQDAWYHDDVAYVYQNALFNGESPTTFEPENKMQRCMMTTVLHRLAGRPTVSYSEAFLDIPSGQWYTDGTIWAGQLGVVSGVGGGLFDPFSNVTRQEIAVILYRYAEKMGYDVSVSASLSGFWDAASVAPWGSAAMSWAVGAGILNGNSGALLPNGDATRAEVAAMLHRFALWTAR